MVVFGGVTRRVSGCSNALSFLARFGSWLRVRRWGVDVDAAMKRRACIVTVIWRECGSDHNLWDEFRRCNPEFVFRGPAALRCLPLFSSPSTPRTSLCVLRARSAWPSRDGAVRRGWSGSVAHSIGRAAGTRKNHALLARVGSNARGLRACASQFSGLAIALARRRQRCSA